MPKKKTNSELLKSYIESRDNITEQTKKTYTHIANNLPFNVLTSQQTIIKKLNDLYENPNTKSLNLNMIILVRKHNEEETDKLIKFRNSLRDDIIKIRKEKMTETKNKIQGIIYAHNYYFASESFDIHWKTLSLASLYYKHVY